MIRIHVFSWVQCQILIFFISNGPAIVFLYIKLAKLPNQRPPRFTWLCTYLHTLVACFNYASHLAKTPTLVRSAYSLPIVLQVPMHCIMTLTPTFVTSYLVNMNMNNPRGQLQREHTEHSHSIRFNADHSTCETLCLPWIILSVALSWCVKLKLVILFLSVHPWCKMQFYKCSSPSTREVTPANTGTLVTTCVSIPSEPQDIREWRVCLLCRIRCGLSRLCISVQHM